MGPVTEYTIVDADSNEKIHSEVRRRIADGWEPQGGVVLWSGIKEVSGPFSRMPCTFFYQAMVKRGPVGSTQRPSP